MRYINCWKGKRYLCKHISFCCPLLWFDEVGGNPTCAYYCACVPGLWSWTQSPSNFGWLEPNWKLLDSESRSLKFGFRFHKHSLWGKPVVKTTMVFSFQCTKSFCCRSQKI